MNALKLTISPFFEVKKIFQELLFTTKKKISGINLPFKLLEKIRSNFI